MKHLTKMKNLVLILAMFLGSFAFGQQEVTVETITYSEHKTFMSDNPEGMTITESTNEFDLGQEEIILNNTQGTLIYEVINMDVSHSYTEGYGWTGFLEVDGETYEIHITGNFAYLEIIDSSGRHDIYYTITEINGKPYVTEDTSE